MTPEPGIARVIWIAVVLGLIGVAYAFADRDPTVHAETPHGTECSGVCERAGMELDGMLWERGDVTCVCSARGRL